MDEVSGLPTPAETAGWFAGKDLTTDWLAGKLKVWLRVLAPLREQPVEILEIGSFEGRSAIAFLEYLPKSRITCVDRFELESDVETRFDGNMSHYPDRVEKIKARAVPALDTLRADQRTFDLIYLDAGKDRDGTFTQAVGAWPLLKVGGILIFDDLLWRPDLPSVNRPEDGIRLFCASFGSCLTTLEEGYQMIVKKTGVWPDARTQTPARLEGAAVPPGKRGKKPRWWRWLSRVAPDRLIPAVRDLSGGLRQMPAVGRSEGLAMRPSGSVKPSLPTDSAKFPTAMQLVAEFEAFAQGIDPLERCLKATRSGVFFHPDGRDEELGMAKINVEAAALLSHLCQLCPTPLSVEVGFGVGTSATVILGTRAALNAPFEHLIYDPYGLGGGKGSVVESYLDSHFGESFNRIRKPSEIGLGQLLHERKHGCAGLVFIDGGHLFENVMTDFVLADKLCCQGGTIVFDDAWFPAIETVLNYIRANRRDYAIVHLPVRNTSVVKKIGPDKREWSAFKPFAVPQREDWTAAWH